MAKLIKIDRNGSKHWEGMSECPRCSGSGVYIIGVCNGQPVLSPVDSGVCFKCLGSGKVYDKWIERTPEYQAKLDARREAKRLKWEEEHAEEIAKAEEERQERIRKEEEKKKRIEEEKKAKEIAEAERKARSNFYGEVGQKIEMELTYNHRAYFKVKSFYGFGTEEMNIYNFSDDNGNTFVWKTTSSLMIKGKSSDDWQYPEDGQRVVIKGTIKEHNEYKDEKQTVLNRVKLLEIK